jgi:hypothetical protein
VPCIRAHVADFSTRSGKAHTALKAHKALRSTIYNPHIYRSGKAHTALRSAFHNLHAALQSLYMESSYRRTQDITIYNLRSTRSITVYNLPLCIGGRRLKDRQIHLMIWLRSGKAHTALQSTIHLLYRRRRNQEEAGPPYK